VPPLSPAARARRDRAHASLRVLLLLACAGPLWAGLERAFAPAGPPPEALTVDLARDPPWRLRLLPGIGRARSLAILEDRREQGPVERLEDLGRIPGFDPSLLDALRNATTVRVLVAGQPIR